MFKRNGEELKRELNEAEAQLTKISEEYRRKCELYDPMIRTGKGKTELVERASKGDEKAQKELDRLNRELVVWQAHARNDLRIERDLLRKEVNQKKEKYGQWLADKVKKEKDAVIKKAREKIKQCVEEIRRAPEIKSVEKLCEDSVTALEFTHGQSELIKFDLQQEIKKAFDNHGTAEQTKDRHGLDL